MSHLFLWPKTVSLLLARTVVNFDMTTGCFCTLTSPEHGNKIFHKHSKLWYEINEENHETSYFESSPQQSADGSSRWAYRDI